MMELPIFAIDNTVVFPRMVVPLYVYEPQYVRLVDDVLSKPENERLFIMATYIENPEIYSTGTVCRIIQSDRNQDGTYHLLVVSLMSCEIDEIYDYVLDYRMARIDTNDEDWSGVDPFEMKSRLVEILKNEFELLQEMGVNVLDTTFDKMLSIVAFSLPCSLDEKMKILREYRILQRYQLVLTYLQESRILEPFIPLPRDYRIVN